MMQIDGPLPTAHAGICIILLYGKCEQAQTTNSLYTSIIPATDSEIS